MPIYEFYCADCHTVFNFLSRTVNTEKRPPCPRCRKLRLEKWVSAFSTRGRAAGGGEAGEGEGGDDLPVDEAKMESALTSLASEAESIGEDDPRQAAGLMRKFSKMTGIEFGAGMQEALNRMEAGEDPEAIESEMGDAMENEEPFLLPGQKGGRRKAGRVEPFRDQTLYEL